MRSLLFAVLPLIAQVIAVPTLNGLPHIVHEKRAVEPMAWSRRTRAAGHDMLHMKVALRQRNLENADVYLHEISDPDSPNFGRHWTSEQVANAFAPSRQTVKGVVNWLIESGIDLGRLQHVPGRHWIEFNASIAEAEELLKTEYHVFEHGETGHQRVSCDSYSLPGHIQDHVDFVMPTVHLEGMTPAKIMTQLDASKGPAASGLHGLKYCGRLVSIDCLRALYNFGKANHTFSNNMLGITEWEDYLYYPDLVKYFQNWTNPRIPDNVRPNFVSIDGGKEIVPNAVQLGLTGEPSLDFDIGFSIIYPQTINYYEVGDGINVDSVGTFNIFLDALDGSYCTYQGGDTFYLDPQYPDDYYEGGYNGTVQCGGAPMSSVFTTSYTQTEAALPRFYQTRQCNEWMKLGLQGVSVMFSSGDSGVATRYNGGYNNSCVNPQYGTVDQFGTAFAPNFPVNCPYVTAVGATQLKGNKISDGEIAVNFPDSKDRFFDYYSSGGFSNVFPRPSWQNSQVTTYLKKYAPSYGSSVYNRSGRGIPDVSAIGANVPIVVDGETFGAGGTSASSPIFASLINLINGERIAAGKKAVGFLNQILYKNPQMFNDITVGSNPGCGTKGFPASPGWDPVTGLGTPNYEKMKAVFMGLP